MNTDLNSLVIRLILLTYSMYALCLGGDDVRAQAVYVVRVGTTETLQSFDPADSGDVYAWGVLSHLYMGLTRYTDPEMPPALALAASHTASPDHLVHTFALRPEAQFADGTPITARTLADSITRAARLGGRGAAVVAQHIEQARADGDMLTLQLLRPLPMDYVRMLVALPPFAPVHPTVFPPDRLVAVPQKHIGNSIYRLKDEIPISFDDFQLEPLVDAAFPVQITRFALPRDMRMALTTDQIDLAWRTLTPDDVAAVVTNTPGGGSNLIQVVTAPAMQGFYLLINQASKPLDDPAVRQAIARLIDRERIVRLALGGVGSPLDTLISDVQADNTTQDDARYPALDLEAALQVLASAGYGSLRRIEADLRTATALYGDWYSTAADLMVNFLARQDAFRVGRFDLEPGTFREALTGDDYRLALIGWTPVVPHPEAYLRPLLVEGIIPYRDGPIAELLNRVPTSDDFEARYRQAAQRAAEQLTVIPIWQARQVALVGPRIAPPSVILLPNYQLRLEKLTFKLP